MMMTMSTSSCVLCEWLWNILLFYLYSRFRSWQLTTTTIRDYHRNGLKGPWNFVEFALKMKNSWNKSRVVRSNISFANTHIHTLPPYMHAPSHTARHHHWISNHSWLSRSRFEFAAKWCDDDDCHNDNFADAHTHTLERLLLSLRSLTKLFNITQRGERYTWLKGGFSANHLSRMCVWVCAETPRRTMCVCIR